MPLRPVTPPLRTPARPAAPPVYRPVPPPKPSILQAKVQANVPAKPLVAQPKSLAPPPAMNPRMCLAPPPVYRPTAPVQMTSGSRAEKRVKNVLTLGLRKVYVNQKRAARANAALAPVHVATAENPLAKHQKAYDKAVFYHNTGPHNAPSIHRDGLLNQPDRVKKYGEDVVGMSLRGGPEYHGDEKKGVFLGARKFAISQGLNGQNVRAVLPPERTNEPIHWFDDEKPTGYDDGRLFMDEKFRGGGLFTPASIHAEHVWTGRFTELPEDRQRSICQTIAQHYDGPKPTWQEVLDTHLEAIDEGYVSDEALDDRGH